MVLLGGGAGGCVGCRPGAASDPPPDKQNSMPAFSTRSTVMIVAHTKQSRPDSGLDLQVEVLTTF